MAIVQASLADEILSRQERAVLRGIYRASQLAEALVSLNKTCSVLAAAHDGADPKLGDHHSDQYSDTSTTKLGDYLSKAIIAALAATKTPTPSNEGKSPNTPDTKA